MFLIVAAGVLTAYLAREVRNELRASFEHIAVTLESRR